jgi:S1-C subfamily serine protease
VPRVHDAYVDCVVYIYRSLDDAKAGVRLGGSGFVTQVALRNNPAWSQIYILTNRHVVTKAKTPVVRLNKFDGTVEYFQTGLDQWAVHPSGDGLGQRGDSDWISGV